MTIGKAGRHDGELLKITREVDGEDAIGVEFDNRTGCIGADLTVGADSVGSRSLGSNGGISCTGVKLFGQGFVVDAEQAARLGLGATEGIEAYIRPYITAREITQIRLGRYALDFLGLEPAAVAERFPAAYQWLVDHVKPEREHNNRDAYRRYWWLFGEPRKTFRKALGSLRRQIVTPETAKHRFFQFLPAETIAEGTLVLIASDDAWFLRVLSSRIHVTWSLAAGGRLGVGNDPRYNKTRCFDPFPFPEATDFQKSRIRALGEQLDAHRKRQQALHPGLTMTGMYNVLEKLRSGGTLTAKDQAIHEQGLVSVLRQIHDDLDAAVADAYGWPVALSDEQILERLVALNHQRAEEERGGA